MNAMRELTRDELLDQRNHYMAGCSCPMKGLCVPHGWLVPFAMSGHNDCSAHDHAERRSGIDRRGRPLTVDDLGPSVFAVIRERLAGYESGTQHATSCPQAFAVFHAIIDEVESL